MLEKCGFTGCEEFLGPDGAEIGYMINGKLNKLKACGRCTHMVRVSPRGTFEITEDKRLKPLPARPEFFF